MEGIRNVFFFFGTETLLFVRRQGKTLNFMLTERGVWTLTGGRSLSHLYLLHIQVPDVDISPFTFTDLCPLPPLFFISPK